MRKESESSLLNEPKTAGRPRTNDPAKHKYEFRLTAIDDEKFKQLFAQSGKKSYSDFIRARVFSEQFHVTIADQNTQKFYDELKNIKAEIRKIGVSYNNYITTLRNHFTESKAAEISRKNAHLLGEILLHNERALNLTLQVVRRWIGK